MKGSLASLALLVTITVASDYVTSLDSNDSASTALAGGTTRTGGKSGGRGHPGRGGSVGGSAAGGTGGRVATGRTSH